MKKISTYILLFLISTQVFGQIPANVKSIFEPEDTFIYTYPNIKLPAEINISKSKLDSFSKKKTEEFINYFLTQNATGLKQALNRWLNHQKMISKSKLKKTPYTYLGISSSACNVNFIGEYNRAGIYQLSFPIAAKYGLRMNSQIDERKGEKVSKAIVSYISDLEKIYKNENDVLLAFYNSQAGLNRAKKRSKSTSIHKYYFYLPEDTRDLFFINKALSYIIERADFGDLIEPKSKIERVSIPKEINLIAFEKVTQNNISTLKKLNPILITNTLPNGIWRFPIEWNIKYELDSIYFYQDSIMNNPNYGKVKDTLTLDLIETFYKVKKGENLLMISQWYNLNTNEIKIWNKIPNNKVNNGQVLKLFVEKDDEADLSKINYLSLDEKNELLELTSFIEALKEFEFYTVVNGDALYLIAQKYKGVTADDIMRWNGISPNIQPGQKILIKNK